MEYEKLTLELSQEEIVTRLLSSNQIIKNQNNMTMLYKTKTLGEFLKESKNDSSELPIISKYSFIKSKWVI